MSREAVYGQIEEEGVVVQELSALSRLYPVPGRAVPALLAAGIMLGALGDALLRAPGQPGLNLSLWIASVAAAALVLHQRAALPLDRERVGWLAIGVLFAAALSWRDAEVLKLLALGGAALTFALAAYRRTAAWARHAGIVRYGVALALAAVHAGLAAILALVDAQALRPRRETRAARWRRAAAVARGLAIAAPLIFVFGALFVSADVMFERLIVNGLRFEYERVGSHVLLFAVLAWLSTGYLRGFLSGTDRASQAPGDATPDWPRLGTTEVATALGAVDALFLAFVAVQFRYLFGAGTLVQVTPDLTYADYARSGFFELVAAVVLVVPVLLAADWLVDRRTRRDAFLFRMLAGAQIGLVLAIAASALQRLRLYHANYGLTESRFYAMVLLVWIAAMLVWLAVTVLRGRRDLFAFGTLTSGLATIAMLFVLNPDAIVARANVARMVTADARVRFDVAYATSLSADAVPVLIDALPVLASDVQCPLARHLLRSWPPGRYRYVRSWNWSAARAGDAVRAHETQLRSMAAPDLACAGGTLTNISPHSQPPLKTQRPE